MAGSWTRRDDLFGKIRYQPIELLYRAGGMGTFDPVLELQLVEIVSRVRFREKLKDLRASRRHAVCVTVLAFGEV
jgi:hypothetical protein